jgi:hypothetical protein
MESLRSSRNQGRPKDVSSVAPIRLGSEFDLTFDMTDDASPPPARVLPFGSKTFSTMHPTTYRPMKLPDDLDDTLLVGSNAPEVHELGILAPHAMVVNRPPITMSQFAARESGRTNSVRSSASTGPPRVKAKMYVFGYREEAEYVPKPFISSHRPKMPKGERPLSARRDSFRRRTNVEKPVKLSKRRRVVLESDGKHSVVIGSFDQFEKQYRGP